MVVRGRIFPETPKNLINSETPPHSTVTTARTADWTGPLGQISRQTTRTLRIDALARHASTAGQALFRARPTPLPQHPRVTHHTHAPSPTSRGIHHIECSASAPHLRSSAPPLLSATHDHDGCAIVWPPAPASRGPWPTIAPRTSSRARDRFSQPHARTRSFYSRVPTESLQHRHPPPCKRRCTGTPLPALTPTTMAPHTHTRERSLLLASSLSCAWILCRQAPRATPTAGTPAPRPRPRTQCSTTRPRPTRSSTIPSARTRRRTGTSSQAMPPCRYARTIAARLSELLCGRTARQRARAKTEAIVAGGYLLFRQARALHIIHLERLHVRKPRRVVPKVVPGGKCSFSRLL